MGIYYSSLEHVGVAMCDSGQAGTFCPNKFPHSLCQCELPAASQDLYNEHIGVQVTSLSYKLFGLLAFACLAVGAVARWVYRRCVGGRDGERDGDGDDDSFSESELAFLALESNAEDDNDMSFSSSDVLLSKKKKQKKRKSSKKSAVPTISSASSSSSKAKNTRDDGVRSSMKHNNNIKKKGNSGNIRNNKGSEPSNL